MLSRCTMGAMASKKARASSPVSACDRLRQRRRGERAGGDDRLVPFLRRQAGDLLAHDGDQRVRFELGRHGCGKAVAVDGKRAARRHLVPVGAGHDQRAGKPHLGMQQADRIGSASSERKELEQTSSARPSVLCASVPRTPRISCRTTGTPGWAICQAASEPARPPPTM